MCITSDSRGRAATSPWAMPLSAWKEVLLRTWREAGDDNVGIVAGGVAFYGFLALVPLLGAVVLSYGLIAEPQTVIRNMQVLTSIMPTDAAKLVGEQLMNVVHTSEGKKGLGLLAALGIALFGARNAAGAVITALNIAYEEKEKRGFLIVNLLALAITAAGVVVAILAVVTIAAFGHLEQLLPSTSLVFVIVGKLLSFTTFTLVGAAGAATLYRYGPSRERPRWTWLTPGSLLAAVLWLALTLGFGIYVANFGNYNATYGSLGAIVVLLTWLYLSSYILLFGAELNAELEHQTTHDTTSGPARDIGDRGAWAADHVAGKDNVHSASAILPPRSAEAILLRPARGTRLVPLAAVQRAGALSSGFALLGLGLIRRENKAAKGIGLLVVAAGISWLLREREQRAVSSER